MDLTKLKNETTRELVKAFGSYVEGSASDLQNFGAAIVEDWVNVAQIEDDAEREREEAELRAQMRAYAELNRVTLRSGFDDFMKDVLKIGGRVLKAALKAFNPLT